ncbi:MAG: SocA family protein [Gammaproteobacteria bacterium]|nr:SocA family protein [Gammaproteobacteria bacterium]MCI0590745.1 SocA family protein [Gammaproteobacteria bacterium]
MKFNREKFKTLVHYICRECREPSKLGKTKLHKILWLSDVQNYLLRAAPLTGERYIKLKFGPCADHLDSILDELRAEGLLHIERTEHEGYDQFEFYAKGEPNKGLFTEKELATINDQMRLVIEDHTAGSISDRSHDEIWRMAIMREEIPYQAYLVKRFAKPSKKDLDWANAEIRRIQGHE